MWRLFITLSLAFVTFSAASCEQQSSSTSPETEVTSSGQASSLARFLGAATTDDCPDGGVELEYGIDVNGNGVLDDDEVDGSHALCHGAPGKDGEPCVTTALPDGGYEIDCGSGEPVVLNQGGQCLPG